MAVYVDDMRAHYGRMIMCHMLADSSEELIEMAVRIGVSPRWLQNEGTAHEHFDISIEKRRLAIQYGAREITRREVGALLAERRSRA